MSIWKRVYGSLSGGWKTYGPNAIVGPGAFDSNDGEFESITAETAIKLSAVWACQNLRAETIGTFPLHLRDANKKILTDHPLYRVLHISPNADQTAPEYWSLQTAVMDMHGNSISVIERGAQKKVIALTPVDPCSNPTYSYNKSGTRKTWKIGQDDVDDADILHLSGFGMTAGWGAPRLEVGRQILSAQLSANTSALRAFKQGLKVGGFFLNEGKRDLTTEELDALSQRLNTFGRPENAGKWMSLLRGLKPIAGTEFAVKPADAQLLESRYFGIEEICRLYGVPPPLIGHTSKASSWASSIENLNLFFQMYSMQPTVIRAEASISKKLLTPYDIAAGVQPKFAMQGLLRGDLKSRTLFYASGLQNGYLSQNDVLDFEDRPGIGPEGDIYRVQLNMSGADPAAAMNDTSKSGSTAQ